MATDDSGYWDDDADRDALLEEVERRGRRARVRRRAAAGAGGLAIAALALAATTLWNGDGGSAPLQVATESSLPTGPTGAADSPSNTAVGPTTTITTPAVTVAVTVAPPPATAGPSPTTTVAIHPGTTTTTLDPSVPPGPDCEAGHFTAVASVDKPSYTAGEKVRFEAEFVKKAGAPCYWVSALGSASLTGPGGQAFGLFPSVIADTFAYTAAEAGEDFHHGAEWDPLVCENPPCQPPPPGTYVATIRYAPFGEASTTFEVVAG